MRKQMVRTFVVALVVLAAVAVVWAAIQAGSTVPRPAAAHQATGAATGSLLNPASLKSQAPAVFDAKFTTSKGDFVIEVTRAWSPHGADRFYNLVKSHFYDGAAFFRVVQGFVVQFGLSPRPDVSRAWASANIPDDTVSQSNAKGTVTFATAGPNTRTTQVFINLGDNSSLDSMGFSPFGKVISGMDVVDKLYAEYGDGPPSGNGPDQGRIQNEGKPYLEKSFPQLDVIKTAVVVPVAPAAGTGSK